MTTLISAIWLVSWLYRVRPRNAHQHAQGSPDHIVVQATRRYWYCCTCPYRTGYRPPWKLREWSITGAAIAATAGLILISIHLGEMV